MSMGPPSPERRRTVWEMPLLAFGSRVLWAKWFIDWSDVVKRVCCTLMGFELDSRRGLTVCS